MMKFSRKVIVSLAAASLGLAPLVTFSANQAVAYAVTQNQTLLSLGASLTAEEAEQTRQLLGANGIQVDKTLYINGDTINTYLNDGSNSATSVYSSAMIQSLPAGSGVQVQIITPQNIQLVKPVTYQNAAITSGATDVLIKIATIKPVTGEGALTGVYALLEQAGIKVDKQAIKVAEKEIKIVEQTKQETPLTDNEINKLILDVKTEVTRLVSANREVDPEAVVALVLTNNPDIKVPDSTREVLKQLAAEFAKTEAAKQKETLDQLKSIDVSNDFPYKVDLKQYGNGLVFSRDDINYTLTINSQDGNIVYGQNEGKASLKPDTLKTKEITVVANDGSTRQVKINTAMTPQNPEGIVPSNLTPFYVFVNKDGGLSLATPDYAGRYPEGTFLEWKLTTLAPPAVTETIPAETQTSTQTSVEMSDQETQAPEITQTEASQESQSESQETQAPENTTESTEEMTESTEEMTESTESITESTEETTETSSQETTVSLEDKPYAVQPEDLETLTTFYLEGVNVPNNIEYDRDEGKLTLKKGEGDETGLVTLTQEATKEIRIFSADRSGIRTIKVNTKLSIDRGEGQTPYEMYLFINKDGKLVLVTPNFAGNVSAEEADVMLEYIEVN